MQSLRAWRRPPTSRQWKAFSKEQRQALRNVFDAQAYARDHPDVAAAYPDVLQHFLEHGLGEGRTVVWRHDPSAVPALHDWAEGLGGVPVGVRPEEPALVGPDVPLPSLGVVVPLFGRVDYIEQCLQSLARQSRPFDAVVLVDDGVGSSTLGEVCQTYLDVHTNWRIVVLPENVGIVGATNRGIDEIDTEYVAFVDCDDLVDSAACARVVASLATGPCELLSTRYATFSDDPFDVREVRLDRLREVYPDERLLMLEHLYTSHLKVFSKAFLSKVGGFPVGTDGVQDWHLAVHASQEGTVRLLDEVLYLHRVHRGQTTHTDRSAFMRSINARRREVLQRRAPSPFADAWQRRMRDAAELLSRGESADLPALALWAAQDGGLRAAPGSVALLDLLAAEAAPAWLLLSGSSWLDIGALRLLGRDDRPLLGLLVQPDNATSIHMARWYSGYLDAVFAVGTAAEAVLLGYLPEEVPVHVLEQTGTGA